jgi:hypothetical protein
MVSRERAPLSLQLDPAVGTTFLYGLLLTTGLTVVGIGIMLWLRRRLRPRRRRQRVG